MLPVSRTSDRFVKKTYVKVFFIIALPILSSN